LLYWNTVSTFKNGDNTFAAYRRNVDWCETIIAIFVLLFSMYHCAVKRCDKYVFAFIYAVLLLFQWSHDLHHSGPCDVIVHVTIRSAISHFLLVVLWKRASTQCISNGFRDIRPERRALTDILNRHCACAISRDMICTPMQNLSRPYIF